MHDWRPDELLCDAQFITAEFALMITVGLGVAPSVLARRLPKGHATGSKQAPPAIFGWPHPSATGLARARHSVE